MHNTARERRDKLVPEMIPDQIAETERLVAETFTRANRTIQNARELITVLIWGGSVLALVLSLTVLFVEIMVPGHKHGALGTFIWGFVLLGLVAANVGVILDRLDDSSES